MTFNIRQGRALDGSNRWYRRREMVVEVIRAFDPHLLAAQEVTRGGRPVPLTRTEWRIVALLARRPGLLTTQRQLLAEVWGMTDAAPSNSYVRVFLVSIRRKLEPDPHHPRYFRTEPGFGVRFVPGSRPGRNGYP